MSATETIRNLALRARIASRTLSVATTAARREALTNIADTLIRNEKVKNSILNNIAFSYLLEDQNMVNNQKFLDIYRKYSTDNSSKNEILKMNKCIHIDILNNKVTIVKV